MYDRQKCQSCIYSAVLNEHDCCCIYILVEHKRRGCYGSGDCEKYEERTSQRRVRINKDGGFVYYD